MNSTVHVVILSVVTLTLILEIGWYITTNPYAAFMIVPILAGVALVIRAIAGSPQPPDKK